MPPPQDSQRDIECLMSAKKLVNFIFQQSLSNCNIKRCRSSSTDEPFIFRNWTITVQLISFWGSSFLHSQHSVIINFTHRNEDLNHHQGIEGSSPPSFQQSVAPLVHMQLPLLSLIGISWCQRVAWVVLSLQQYPCGQEWHHIPLRLLPHQLSIGW